MIAEPSFGEVVKYGCAPAGMGSILCGLTSVPAPPGPTTFAPSGLKLWLSGRFGLPMSGPVSLWSDQSGNGHDFTQGTSANQPSIGASINGRPTVEFPDGNSGQLRFLSNATDISNFVTTSAWTAVTVQKSASVYDPGGGVGSGDYTCVMIISGATTAIWGIPLRGNSPGSPTTLEAYQFDGAAKAVGQTINTPTACQTTSLLSAGTLSMSINGAAPSTLGGVGNALVVADTMQIGARRGGAGVPAYQGSMAEIMIWNRALTSLEQTAARTYCSYFWGV